MTDDKEGIGVVAVSTFWALERIESANSVAPSTAKLRIQSRGGWPARPCGNLFEWSSYCGGPFCGSSTTISLTSTPSASAMS